MTYLTLFGLALILVPASFGMSAFTHAHSQLDLRQTLIAWAVTYVMWGMATFGLIIATVGLPHSSTTTCTEIAQ